MSARKLAAQNTAFFRIPSVVSALVLGACVFHPPPPLPEELAALEQARAEEEQDAEDALAERESFEPGQPAPPGLSEAEILAYNRDQGDPIQGHFPLAAALEGIETSGSLRARLTTSKGLIDCELFEGVAPLTVANFVGLSRGLRPFRDPDAPLDAPWVQRPYYDATQFHRVIPGFMVQGGDPTASGTVGPGYLIPDEIRGDSRFDRAGLLAMANRGPNTGGAQFFVTLGPVPHLNGAHTIFGRCTPDSAVVAAEIAAVERDANDRPTVPVLLERVEIYRAIEAPESASNGADE